MTTQLTFDDIEPAPADDEETWTLGDVATSACRQACDLFGVETLDQDLLRVLQGDKRHRNVAAELLLMHLEDIEDDELLFEDSCFYQLAMLGARQLVDITMGRLLR